MEGTIFLILLLVILPMGRFGTDIIHTETFYYSVVGIVVIAVWELLRN